MRAMSRVLMATAVVGTTLALAGLSDAAFVLLNPADYMGGFVEKGCVYDIQRDCMIPAMINHDCMTSDQ
jgi:hypothetical protein